MSPVFAGLWPPVATPFTADGAVNTSELVRHGRTLLSDGAHGLAVLGTTSEANSLTLTERRLVIDALVEAGVPADNILPGTGACAIGDAAELSRHAGDLGCAGVLLLPPFYYKGVSDEGLFRFVASLIERCGAKAPRIMLYHIPPMAVIGWSLELVGRLMEAFPEIVVGMKDSSGDYEHTKSVIEAFPDLAVFPGAEVYLLKALRDGSAGCISATANINAGGIRALLDGWKSADAESRQDQLTAVRRAVQGRGLIPSI
jgi:4-hydroxy-tetrahydrodipicolinate synthase